MDSRESTVESRQSTVESTVESRRSRVQGRQSAVDGHGRASGWRLFARTVAARAYPRLIMNVREKWWLVFDIVLPLIGLCAYVFIYRANNAPADLIGFVIIGGAMSAYWMNVLVVDGEPAVLGEGDGQPGALHHGAELDDGDSAGHGARRHVHDDPARGAASSPSAACCSTCSSPSRACRCWRRCSCSRSSRSTAWG